MDTPVYVVCGPRDTIFTSTATLSAQTSWRKMWELSNKPVSELIKAGFFVVELRMSEIPKR